MTQSQTFIERELGFVIIATPDEYHVDYKVYEIVGERMAPDQGLVFHNNDGNCHPNPVDTIEEATPYLDGHVKWDGCSNWTIGYNDSRAYLMHFCSREKLENLGKVLAKCWDLTAKLCSKWLD
jgi:hypothetical protein